MSTDVEFANMYITRLMSEVMELTKNRMLVETQLHQGAQLVAALSERVESLERDLVIERDALAKARAVKRTRAGGFDDASVAQ